MISRLRVKNTTRLFAGGLLAAVSLFSQAGPAQKAKFTGLLIFDVLPSRLAPSEMTVPEGDYLIRVRNGMSQRETPVVLEDEKLARSVDAKIRQGSISTSRIVALKAGKHRIRVGARAGWTATIVVIAAKEHKN